MKQGTVVLCLGAVLMTGCVHTTISHQMVSADTNAPYRKLLVCSMSSSPERAQEFENAIVAQLKPHRLEVVPCSLMLNAGKEQAAVKSIRKEGYDGVLVIHRQALVQNENAAGAKVEQWSVEQLVHDYRQGSAVSSMTVTNERVVTSLAGPERVISGEVDLFDLKSNSIVWSSGGTLEGTSGQPLSAFVRAAALSAEKQLLHDRIIRK